MLLLLKIENNFWKATKHFGNEKNVGSHFPTMFS